jgi:hypothetical protein
MFLDASHQQQQQQQGEQADALQQPDQGQERVWHLLLGHLGTPLDQAVISKLLCCSQTMADLIHTKCTGEPWYCSSGMALAMLLLCGTPPLDCCIVSHTSSLPQIGLPL